MPSLCPSLPPPFLHLAPTTAVVSADVRCGACGGGGGEGVEPQSGNRSEAAQLHLAADLATRDQPDELPAHGKHLMNATAPICASCLLQVSVMKRSLNHLLSAWTDAIHIFIPFSSGIFCCTGHKLLY